MRNSARAWEFGATYVVLVCGVWVWVREGGVEVGRGVGDREINLHGASDITNC